ncbi:MAG: ATP-dependent DNA helicase RecG [Chitinispirillaceae bacterium]
MTSETRKTSRLDFLSPLHSVPGLGPKRLQALQAAGLKTIGDLLHYYPLRYVDRSRIIPLNEIKNFKNTVVTVTGTVTHTRLERGRRSRFRIAVADDVGQMEAVWFQGVTYISKTLKKGDQLILTGKVTFYGHYQIVHPLVDKISSKKSVLLFYPVYSVKEVMKEAGLNQKILHKSVSWVFKNLKNFPRVLPQNIEKKYRFPPLEECLQKIHQPDDISQLDSYRARLKYEELYKLALTLRWNRKKFALPGRSMSPGDLERQLRDILPFALTPSQEAAVSTLFSDAASKSRMHRLLQGDVGSGKTVTALFACLPALKEGCQVAWMAPTDVLARQTLQVLSKYLEKLGFPVEFLGASSGKDKARILKELASGKLQFVVGTHALFTPSVRFGKLGMIVIDEQHKFGAAQRLALQEKGPSADFLLMSATPIPQTLARTLYGDLDIVEIESPPRREPVSTHVVPSGKRSDMEAFILKQISSGSRVFYVVPRIDDMEAEDNAAQLKSVDKVAAELGRGVLGAVAIEKLHGQMPFEKRDEVMRRFSKGEPGVLVCTSIVEVGVDVRDASVMVIENAERFGLAQLHQIRGRVGRGEKKSFCFLLSGANADCRVSERLKYLCGCHDGFKLAEWDLHNRGPGEVDGFRQSGWDDLRIADILEDAALFREILKDIEALFR